MCPGGAVVNTRETVGEGYAPLASDKAYREAVRKAADAIAAAKADLTCAPHDPPCLLIFEVRQAVAHSDRAGRSEAKDKWSVRAVCHATSRGSSNLHLTMPPPAGGQRSAGGGSSGAGGVSAPPAKPAPPLVECDCQQLAQLLAELKADEAKEVAAERALTGKIKSAQLTGGPTGALEAQLSVNADQQASLAAWIKVVEGKLQHCPQACPPPGTDFTRPPQNQGPR